MWPSCDYHSDYHVRLLFYNLGELVSVVPHKFMLSPLLSFHETSFSCIGALVSSFSHMSLWFLLLFPVRNAFFMRRSARFFRSTYIGAFSFVAFSFSAEDGSVVGVILDQICFWDHVLDCVQELLWAALTCLCGVLARKWKGAMHCLWAWAGGIMFEGRMDCVSGVDLMVFRHRARHENML